MRFRPNPQIEQQLAHEPEMRRALANAAELAKTRANQIVESIGGGWMPRRGGGRDTIQIHTDGDEVLLVNTDYGGHLQEFGSRNNPPHAPLRRGVRAAGLRLAEK